MTYHIIYKVIYNEIEQKIEVGYNIVCKIIIYTIRSSKK